VRNNSDRERTGDESAANIGKSSMPGYAGGSLLASDHFAGEG
jgi:hypothetical protein